ncbi:ester cyclase [Streptomyces sp. BH106]|uniref:ester cyclase n=1 Tax=Streptomyces sp. BH106 TaxID=3410409 RepID=UPI003CF15376
MATEQENNKRRLLEMAERCIVGGDLDAVDEYFTPDFWSIAVQHPEPGAEGEKRQVREILASFSEVEYIYTDLVAVDDRVAGRATFRAVHTGEYAGIKPTGARVETIGIDVNRFVDGKIAEHWGCYDDTPIIQQIKAAAEQS